MSQEIDIIEHPFVVLWLKDLTKNDPLCFATLIEGNISRFKKQFGQPTGKTQRYLFWKKDYLGITIFIYSDNYNTFYKIHYLGAKEIFVQDKKIGSYITGFLDKIIKNF